MQWPHSFWSRLSSVLVAGAATAPNKTTRRSSLKRRSNTKRKRGPRNVAPNNSTKIQTEALLPHPVVPLEDMTRITTVPAAEGGVNHDAAVINDMNPRKWFTVVAAKRSMKRRYQTNSAILIRS